MGYGGEVVAPWHRRAGHRRGLAAVRLAEPSAVSAGKVVVMAGLVRRLVVLAGATVVLLGTAAGIAGGAAGIAASRGAAAGTWGTAREVPGTAALNAGGFAAIHEMSCASAGNCSAGGEYVDSSSHRQVFVVSQVRGRWDKAEEVPGTATLNAGGEAFLQSVSCASAGNCSAGGSYTDSSFQNHAFVVSQVGGRWGKAEEVPGTSAGANLVSVSCASAGNCSAGGYYTDSSGNGHAFVVSEVRGKWGTAKEVHGTAAVNPSDISSVSCASAGNCSAVGSNAVSFVVSEVGGRWGTAEEVPGTGALQGRGFAHILFVSCASAGSCSAGGDYSANVRNSQVFVVSEVRGKWGKAEEVPGTATLNARRNAQLGSLSCGSAGNCSAGGFYKDSSGRLQAFVVSQVGGRWGTAEEVPGTATLNTGGNAFLDAVSCASAGNCSAGGYYNDSSGNGEAFVVGQVRGRWGTAEEVPGTATLNANGDAAVLAVWCASAGNCSAGGFYADSSERFQAFVVSQSPR
jgi:D-alanine-D-alanine ligase-like ATP-grasp enzyme